MTNIPREASICFSCQITLYVLWNSWPGPYAEEVSL